MSTWESLNQRHSDILEDASLEDYERAAKLEAIARDYQVAGEREAAQQASAEAMAFRLMLEGTAWPQHDLQPYCVLVDGQTLPALDDFTEDLLHFLDAPIQKAVNPITRARLADVRWEFSKPRKGQSAQLAIDAYAASLKLHLDSENFHLLFEAAKRAARLASQTKDTARLDALLRQWVPMVRALATGEHCRWCARCTEVLSMVSDDMRPEWLIEALRDAITEARQTTRANASPERSIPDQEMQDRDLSEAQLVIQTADGSAADVLRELRLDLVSSYIREGDFYANDQGDPLRALFSYQPAEQIARDIGASSEMNTARAKLASIGAQIDPEELAHTVEVPIDLGHVESLITSLLGDDASDFLARISRSDELRPSVERSKESADQETARAFPLQSFASHLRLRGGHIVSTTGSVGVPAADRLAATLCLHAQLGGLLLDQALARAAETHGLGPADVRRYYADSGFRDESTLDYLELGVLRLLAEDYPSAIHVLVPQVETLCREIVLSRGGTATIPGEGVPQLGTLLESVELVDAIGGDLTQVLKAVLRDSNGMWLRTRVAHGMLPIREATRETAMTVLLLLLQLAPSLGHVRTRDAHTPGTP